MKNLLFYLSFLLIFNSCSFSKGAKISSGGISYSYNGIAPSEVVIIEKESLKRIKSQSLKKYATYELVLNDIQGIKSENGNLKIGSDLKVSDEDNKVLMNYKDFLKDVNLSTSDNSIFLKVYIGKQFEFDKEYTLQSKIWDKRANENIINVEYKFKVIENENLPKIQIKSEGLEYSDVILIDENKIILSNTIKRNKQYFILINDLTKFNVKENRINVRESYALINLKNEVLLSDRNVAKDMDGNEITKIEDINPYVFPIKFNDELKENKMKLGIILEDINNPKNMLELAIDLNLEN